MDTVPRHAQPPLPGGSLPLHRRQVLLLGSPAPQFLQPCLARASRLGAAPEGLQFGAGEPGPMAGRKSRAQGIMTHTLPPCRMPWDSGNGCLPILARARAAGGAH